MKKILLFILAAFTVLLLVSCQEESKETDITPKELVSSIVAEYEKKFDNIPGAKLYTTVSEEDADGYMDPLLAGFTFSKDGRDITELTLTDSFAIRIPEGKSAFEIHCYKVSNASDVSKLESLCNNRIEILKSSNIVLYDPSQDEVIKNAQVVTEGNFVFLISSADNSIAKDVIAKAFN